MRRTHRIISVSLLALSLTAALAQVPAQAAPASAPASKPLQLAANAPDRYIVVPGDTLWDISGKFLTEPYRWPELWRMNADEIRNPHLIYPGQVLVLDRDAPGGPRLRSAGGGSGSGGPTKIDPKIYVEPEKKNIAAIPYEIIQPFLAQPLVMEMAQLDAAPRVVAAENERVLLGAGDRIYVTNVRTDNLTWHIYRPGALLKNAAREPLGYEAVHVGSARLTKTGEPATMTVTRSMSEILMGDRLMPAQQADVIAYAPHAPTTEISGNILTVYGAVGLGGRHSVISISQGARDGVEIGHVLELAQSSKKVDERFNGRKITHTTPEERNGLVFVFRVFDRVSYGLIMSADEPIRVGDVVRTP